MRVMICYDNPKEPISSSTTDIVYVVLEERRKHWTVVHISIASWRAVYYDSLLEETTTDLNMVINCTEAVNALRNKHVQDGVMLPMGDPEMSVEVSHVTPVY